ncbi:hypothetical protein [Capybara microvirus Cap3_SP_478]|nr:hypothetical protein [Capybara microvirus Cap3_SP_478]
MEAQEILGVVILALQVALILYDLIYKVIQMFKNKTATKQSITDSVNRAIEELDKLEKSLGIESIKNKVKERDNNGKD